MKIHWFQHVPFEGLGLIEAWLHTRGHRLTCTRFHTGESPPPAADYDWLIVMGGPMNVYQHRDYPWLKLEKRAIREAVEADRRVLGICLGAQLLADVLGGKVFQNPEREIGWWLIRATTGSEHSRFAFPREATVFHWHGDTFSLPHHAVCLAESAGCANQAFAVGDRLLGLQFHLEMTPAEVGRIADASVDELVPARWVQTRADLVAGTPHHQAGAQALLGRLLAQLESV